MQPRFAQPATADHVDVRPAVVVVVGMVDVDAAELTDRPASRVRSMKRPLAVVLEEAQRVAQTPRRCDDVLQAVAVEILDDAAAGQADVIDAGGHRHVWEPPDVVLGAEDIGRNQPAARHFIRILADCHVGDVQEPLRREFDGSSALRRRVNASIARRAPPCSVWTPPRSIGKMHDVAR